MSSTAEEKSNTQWSKIFPQRLTDNYRKIQILLKPLRNDNKPHHARKDLTHEQDPIAEQTTAHEPQSQQDLQAIVTELENILNDCLPYDQHEQNQHTQEFLHFYKDSEGYYQHLMNSKLRFLVLWTDYKYITKHFRVRNIIHIRWNGTNYECQSFDKSKRVKNHTAT